MSIYLRVDRAPEVCDFCRSQQRDQGIVWCPICGKIGSNEFVCCPIVEIPPHGRLIDEQWLKDAIATTLEALKKNPKMDKQEMHLIAAFDTLRVMIEDAPTIIPEDKEE